MGWGFGTTMRVATAPGTGARMERMFDHSKLAVPGSEEEGLLRQIDPTRLPRHVAIIMDGNGRWARDRLQPRVAGHHAGIRAVRKTVETAARLGIELGFNSARWFAS